MITQEDLDYCIRGYQTGYPWIDYLTNVPGVFFPEGAISEVMGQKATAKTTLIFEAIGHYHKNGGTKKTMYLDFERTVKKQAPYISALGVDIANDELFEYHQPGTLQDGADIVLDMLKNKKKNAPRQQDYAFIVIDTVAAMRPRQEVENKLGDTKQQGLRGKLMSEFLRNLTSDLESDGPAIIFVNQVYEQLSINRAAFLPTQFDSSASNALKYYASFRITLSLRSKLKGETENPFTFEKEETFVGSVIEIMVEKSKIGVPFRKARAVVKYGYGIDPIPTLIQAAINKPNGDTPIIQVGGNKSVFAVHQGGGQYTQNFRGLAALTTYLNENPEEVQNIANQLSPEWAEGMATFSKSVYIPLESEEEDAEVDI